MSLSSMSFDLAYSVTKSIREISPYNKISGINKGADIIRGGFKMAAGILGALSGAIIFWLDVLSAHEESKRKELIEFWWEFMRGGHFWVWVT